jgi:hypothetical protein
MKLIVVSEARGGSNPANSTLTCCYPLGVPKQIESDINFLRVRQSGHFLAVHFLRFPKRGLSPLLPA